MTGLLPHTRALVLALGVSTVSLNAYAFDATSIMERYKAVAATQGQTFTYDSVTPSPTGFSVKGATWQLPDMAPIKAQDLVFAGVEERADGTLLIDTVTLDKATAQGKEINVTFDEAVMSGLRLPKDGETATLEQMAFYRGFQATGGKVTLNGATVAELGSFDISMSEFSATTPMTFKMSLSDSNVDVSSAPDPKFQQTLQQLGYGTSFKVSSQVEGIWDPQSGVMDVTKNDYTIADVGTLSMPVKMAGYTAETVMAMQKQAGANVSEEEAAAAAMETLNDIELQSLDIAFTDASVTKRALTMASQQMQQPPEALAAGAPMMIGLGMAQLQMPELTQMVQAAVGQFLQNPGTLRVSLAPESGTKLMDFAAGAANPQALIEALNVKVTAE